MQHRELDLGEDPRRVLRALGREEPIEQLRVLLRALQDGNGCLAVLSMKVRKLFPVELAAAGEFLDERVGIPVCPGHADEIWLAGDALGASECLVGNPRPSADYSDFVWWFGLIYRIDFLDKHHGWSFFNG